MTSSNGKNRIKYKFIINSYWLAQTYDLNNLSIRSSRDIRPTGFHDLFEDVLLLIFEYFDEKELRKYVMPVCRKWRQTALFPKLWHKLEFNGLNIPEEFIFQQLRLVPYLECASFVNINNAEISIRQLCRCNQNVKVITIKNCKYSEDSSGKFPERVFRNVVLCCKRLEKINLKGTPFSGNQFYIQAAILPNLRSINLSNNPYLRTKNLYELIFNCRNLEELKLSCRAKEQQLSDNDVTFLFAKLKTNLKSLAFDMSGLSDISLSVILACSKLEKLSLYNTSNLSSTLFVDLWKKLPNLQFLKMPHSLIDNEHLTRLFIDGKSTFCNLKMLNMSASWKLNSNGLKTISESCPNLEKVILKCCKNLEIIDVFLDNCQNVETLNLAFCEKIPAEDILKIPQKLSKLKTFYLDFHRQHLLADIKKTYPNLNSYICLSQFSKNTDTLK